MKLLMGVMLLKCRPDQLRLPGYAERLALPSAADVNQQYDLVPGFVKATESEPPHTFRPPKVPRDFVPTHKFSQESKGGTSPPAIKGISAMLTAPLQLCRKFVHRCMCKG